MWLGTCKLYLLSSGSFLHVRLDCFHTVWIKLVWIHKIIFTLTTQTLEHKYTRIWTERTNRSRDQTHRCFDTKTGKFQWYWDELQIYLYLLRAARVWMSVSCSTVSAWHLIPGFTISERMSESSSNVSSVFTQSFQASVSNSIHSNPQKEVKT